MTVELIHGDTAYSLPRSDCSIVCLQRLYLKNIRASNKALIWTYQMVDGIQIKFRIWGRLRVRSVSNAFDVTFLHIFGICLEKRSFK